VTCTIPVAEVVCAKSLHEDGVAYTELTENDSGDTVKVAHPFYPITSCVDTTATTGSVYHYSVQTIRSGAVVEGISAEYRAQSAATQTLDLNLLDQTSSSLRVGWNPMASAGQVQEYTARIYCRAGCSHGSYVTTEETIVTTANEVDFSGLQGGGRMYQLTIMTVLNNLVVENSSIYTLPPGIPGAPGVIYVNQKKGRAMDIGWGPSTDMNGGQAVRYKLESSVDNGGTWELVKSMISGTTYTMTNVTAKMSYKFRVATKNFRVDDGCSALGAQCTWSTWTYSDVITTMSACGNTLGFICSNHGTCDELTGKCLCDPTWQGEFCMTKVATVTAHVVGAGHVLYKDKPVNMYRRGEFVMYDNVMSGEKVHMVFGSHRTNRLLNDWHGATKIAMSFGDQQISIESNKDNTQCPILRQDCVKVSVDKQIFGAEDPLYFESVATADQETVNACSHIAIHNRITGTKVECHMWHQGFLSCHFLMKKWDGMYGLIFDRENQNSNVLASKFPGVLVGESLFEKAKGAVFCSEPAFIEIESQQTATTTPPTVVTTLDEPTRDQVMGSQLDETVASLATADTGALITERKNELALVNAATVQGARNNDCPDKENVLGNCTELEGMALHSVCVEDLCIPDPAGAPATLLEVAKRDQKILIRFVAEADSLVENGVNEGATLYSGRVSGGTASDPSTTVDRVVGEEWWNQCDQKQLVALTSTHMASPSTEGGL